jgi:transposase
MKRATPVHLSEDERTHPQVFVRRGKANARTLTRARILLKCDEGWSNDDIAGALDVSDQTIRNVRQRFEAGGVERCSRTNGKSADARHSQTGKRPI